MVLAGAELWALLGGRRLMPDFAVLRREMVEFQIAARGVRDPRVLEALRTVPREAFVPERLAEFAYEDTPLPIDAEQTISQPYIVALMAEALELSRGDCVLEVGAGSGYAAAVLGRIVDEVWAIERHQVLADQAARRMERLGYSNVHVVQGDGTLGLPEQAPFDAIVVAAGGPERATGARRSARSRRPSGDSHRPRSAPPGAGGAPQGRPRRLLPREPRRGALRPAGRRPGLEGEGGTARRPAALHQSASETRAVDAGAGLEEPRQALQRAPPAVLARPGRISTPHEIAALLRETAEPFDDIEDAELGPLLERIGDCRLVLLGEATHGTSEFYRMRARITRELILRKGFNVVAVEADWPDAAQDRPLRPPRGSGRRPTAGRLRPLPDLDVAQPRGAGVRRLAARPQRRRSREPERKVGFYGLDLYSLYSLDPRRHSAISTGSIPRRRAWPALRYGCLTPWEQDPAAYGQAALIGRYETCEHQVVAMLRRPAREAAGLRGPGRRALSSMRCRTRAWSPTPSATTGSCTTARASPGTCATGTCSTPWRPLLRFRGPEREGGGLGAQLARRQRRRHRDGRARASSTSASSPASSSATAPTWSASAPTTARSPRRPTGTSRCRSRRVRPSHPESYERLCHDAGVPAFLLHLREPRRERGPRRAGRAPARARDRRHLPAGDRAAEPLLPGGPAAGSSTSTSGSTRPAR